MILVCALTRIEPSTLAYQGQLSNQLNYPGQDQVFIFLNEGTNHVKGSLRDSSTEPHET